MSGVSSPDLLAMAESGLLAMVSGSWEIGHDNEAAVWGRAVVKGLQEGVLLTGKPTPCTFGFRHGPNAQATDVYGAAITIHWGPEDSPNYATLESFGKDFLKWRLPLQDDGSPGSYTTWSKMDVDASKRQAAKEAMDVRRRAEDELAHFKRQADTEASDLRAQLVEMEMRAKAADQVSKSRSRAGTELAAVHAKATKEVADVRAKAALSEELAEARARCADEIADENESLRVQLNSQVGSSDSMRDEMKALKMLVMETMSQSTPCKASKFEDLLDEKAWHLKSGRHQDGTPDKELPLDKRRRTDNNVGKENMGNVSSDNNVLAGISLVSCGA